MDLHKQRLDQSHEATNTFNDQEHQKRLAEMQQRVQERLAEKAQTKPKPKE
jgi:hypothetical protein